MSNLNLSSVIPSTSDDSSSNVDAVSEQLEKNVLTSKDEYYCEYTETIWKHLLKQEAEKPPIHLQSPQLAYRGALVQQLRDVAKKLGLSIATLHCAVAQLDLFMDAHRLRADRLTHVALACLSLAAKSEENFSRVMSLKVLSLVSGVQLCGKTFRKLEWMVGQHVRWMLLAPTPVTFASLLAQYVVTDSDLTSRNVDLVKRLKRDGAKLLDAYLDLTLSDVRLKAVESVDVGCACVACARTDLGLCPWPIWLATVSSRKYSIVAPIAKLLQKMMKILKSKETPADVEEDQGYTSAVTTPNLTPCTSPNFQISPASSTYSCHQNPISERQDDSVLDLDDSNVPTCDTQDYHTLPSADVTCTRVDNTADYRYIKSSKLLDTSLDVQPSTSVAVKRGLITEAEIDAKRHCLGPQLTQPQDVLGVYV